MTETDQANETRSVWKHFYPLLLIFLSGCLVYANTFQVPFVFDDTQHIVQNPAVKDFRYYSDSDYAEKAISQEKFDDNFRTRKVTFFTFALNYRLHGLNLAGYHAVNLIIHLVCGLLVYLLGIVTLQPPLGTTGPAIPARPALAGQLTPLFAALFFVVHPLQTQAITYICQRFTSLATLYCLLSLVLYVFWRQGREQQENGVGQRSVLHSVTGGWILYGFSLAAAVLAMFTKEISFTLPVIIFLYEWTFFGRPSAQRISSLLPFAATMLIIPVIILKAESHYSDVARLTGSLAHNADQNFALTYLLTQFRVIVTYLRLLILPVGQNLIHDIPTYTSFLQPPVYLSFLFLCLIAGLGARLYFQAARLPSGQGAWQRLIGFGIFWFFISLAVESSFIPLNDVIFEHRMYRPMAGASFVLLGVGELLRQRLSTRGLRVAALISMLLLGALSVATINRNSIWRSPFELWEDSARKSPNKFRPVFNLGTEYMKEGQLDEAIDLFQKAILLAPGYARLILVYNALEESYKKLNDNTQLQKTYNNYLTMLLSTLKKRPDDPVLYSHLGILYGKMDRFAEAEAALRKVIELKPENAKARANLGSLYLSRNRTAEALTYYQEAVRRDPDNADTQEKLGDALAAMGKVTAAQAAYASAMTLNPELPGIHNKLASLYIRTGKSEEAESVFLQAVGLHGDDPKAHNGLGVYYANLNRVAEAEQEFRTALDLDDNSSEILMNLANILMKKGRFDDALELLNRAGILDPRNPEIHNMMGYSYFQKGDFQASAQACRRVVELSPDDAMAKKRLEQVMQALNGTGKLPAPDPQ